MRIGMMIEMGRKLEFAAGKMTIITIIVKTKINNSAKQVQKRWWSYAARENSQFESDISVIIYLLINVNFGPKPISTRFL